MTNNKKKTKILCYSNSSFNKVVTHNVELEQLHDLVYIYPHEKEDNHSTNDTDRVYVVIKVQTAYIQIGTVKRKTVEERLPEVITMAENYLADIENRIKEGKYIIGMYIRVYEEIGLDTAPLLEAKEKFQEKKRLEEAEKQKQKEKEREEAEQKEKIRLQEVKQLFIDGKSIDCDDFLALCKIDGFELHPRTIGTFNKSVNTVYKDGSLSYSKYWSKGKKRTPKLNGCQDAVTNYRNSIMKKQ